MTDDEIKKLVDNYQPSSDTLKAMARVKLLATVGPSASGKTTIMKALVQTDPNFHFVVGETSRQPRSSEQDGVDLFFRNRDDILADLKAGQLTQIVIGPNGDLYCTRVSNFSTSLINLFPLIPHGVRQFRALSLKFFAAAFIVPDTFEHWQHRLNKQAVEGRWNVEKLRQRLTEAKTSFEFALKDRDTHFVLNDKPQKAARLLRQVAHGQKPDDEDRAKQIAKGDYAKLQNYLTPRLRSGQASKVFMSDVHQQLLEEIKKYKMPVAAASFLRQNPPLIICSVTASGKNTVADYIIKTQPGYQETVSHTTRMSREGEINGVHYWFVNEIKMLELIQNQAFIEVKTIHSQTVYGTSVKSYKKIVSANHKPLLVIDVQGAEEILQSVPEIRPFFILPPSYEEWMSRLHSRGVITAEDKNNRIISARRELQAVLAKPDYVLVLNDKIEKAAKAILNIQTDPEIQDKNRRLAKDLLGQLNS